MTKPFLSIIIPAFNEEKRLPNTLEKVLDFTAKQPYTVEILVVENGSFDNTFDCARSYQDQNQNLIVLQTLSRGKGLAVRTGMLAASGKYRFMCDTDLSMPIQEVNRFLPPTLTDYDIAIGSREVAGAIRYNEPGYRHWGGRGVNLMIRTFAIPGIRDTQCGFKMFRDVIAEDLFNHQTLDNWSFDIELLFIAKMRGYRIQEVPIPWYFNPETKLRPINDAIQMAVDILQIRRNARRGTYDLED